MTVTGYTITEMAERLKIPYDTVRKRLERAGIKPLANESIFPESALDTIRNTPGKGRPRKSPKTAKK
jgi:predicted ArsR family transcriptional regulator